VTTMATAWHWAAPRCHCCRWPMPTALWRMADALVRCGCSLNPLQRCPAHCRASHRCPGGLHRQRHSFRPDGPRTDFWPGQRAGNTLLERRQNRHQQGHARQLGTGLLTTLHRGRLGRQRQRGTNARRQRHHRCGTHLAGAHELPACPPSQACLPSHRLAWCVWMLRSLALKRRAPSGLSVAPSKPNL
jgi:hypothetical protein